MEFSICLYILVVTAIVQVFRVCQRTFCQLRVRSTCVHRVLLNAGQGVSNRDIKLENTLLDRLAPGHKPVVKLCGA